MRWKWWSSLITILINKDTKSYQFPCFHYQSFVILYHQTNYRQQKLKLIRATIFANKGDLKPPKFLLHCLSVCYKYLSFHSIQIAYLLCLLPVTSKILFIQLVQVNTMTLFDHWRIQNRENAFPVQLWKQSWWQ